MSSTSFDHDALLLSMVYSAALGVVRDAATAEDVKREIFTQKRRNSDGSVPTPDGLGPLSVAARNRPVDAPRLKRPLVSVESVEDVGRTVMMEKARIAIHELPPEQRKTLEMAFFDGLTHMEIAEITGDPLSTVKMRIRSALLTLRKAFSDSPHAYTVKTEQNLMVAKARGAVVTESDETQNLQILEDSIGIQELNREDKICSLNMADNLDKVLF